MIRSADPLAHAIRRLASGASLTLEETAEAVACLMAGDASPAQIAALLVGLRVKGETADEIAGAASALRDAMIRLHAERPDTLVDTCGTGGGAVGTFNISTAAAFVALAAGARLAKHGNRSFTSSCGSADVIEALGIETQLTPARAAEVLAEAGMVFLYAPTFHPAMRYVGPVRRELGIPTVMNLAGPLANPAGALRQLVGVSDAARAPLMASALAQLGTTHALVVHGEIGMDEISPIGCTMMWEVQRGVVNSWMLDPKDFGLADTNVSDLAGGSPSYNAQRIEEVLSRSGDGAPRCAVLLNAAAALYVGQDGLSFADAVGKVTAALDAGDAARALERLRRSAPRQSL